MSFLFKKKKSPVELIKSTKKHLEILSDSKTSASDHSMSLEKMSANLSAIKLMLYGDNETEPNEENSNKLCDLLFSSSTTAPDNATSTSSIGSNSSTSSMGSSSM